MLRTMLFSFLIVTVVGLTAVHADLLMFDMGFNVNGTVTEYFYDYGLSSTENGDNAASMMSTIDGYVSSTLSYETGLGTVSFGYDAPGEYTIGSFFDIEINEDVNTFFDETAEVFGTAPADLTWEVDEPGYQFGDIYDNFSDGSFDNFNAVDADFPDDVSIGLAWNFSLEEGEYASLSFSVINSTPAEGFYIMHSDPETGEYVCYSTDLTIQGGGTQSVPEPATGGMLLFGTLVAGAVSLIKRR